MLYDILESKFTAVPLQNTAFTIYVGFSMIEHEINLKYNFFCACEYNNEVTNIIIIHEIDAILYTIVNYVIQ